MELVQVVGLAVVGAAGAVLLRQSRPELALLLSLGCGAALLGWCLGQAQQTFGTVEALLQLGGVDRQYSEILFKCLGICLVSQIAADACRDSGEVAIAAKVELAARFAVLGISLPLFRQLVEIAAALLEV